MNFIRHWWECATIGWDLYLPPWHKDFPQGYGCARVGFWAWLVDRLIAGPTFGFSQAWACELVFRVRDGDLARTRWPFFPAHWATRIHEWVAQWVEDRATWYRWNAPDSGLPDEVGFHSLSDGTRERSPTRIFMSQGPDTSSTLGAQSWTVDWDYEEG